MTSNVKGQIERKFSKSKNLQNFDLLVGLEIRGYEKRRCDKRLQRLQKILCKRVYYFVNVYLNKNHMSETKQNYDGKPNYSALRSNRSLIEFIGSQC